MVVKYTSKTFFTLENVLNIRGKYFSVVYFCFILLSDIYKYLNSSVHKLKQ